MNQTNAAPAVTDDISPELLKFIQEKVNNFVKWDLVRFFHDNPYAANTAQDIARYTGRDEFAIIDELAQLAAAGVLSLKIVSDQKIYSLALDADMRELINNFVRACDDRIFRVRVIYHVIRSMR
ncbi:MAG: hypothetical protein J0L63_14085 [Anaerolineae bacterium]|nr:hypothetical protein [Anaerolineae bacterium]MBN8620033.1 hypothetical protein [Anaerolineae bacterium]